MKTRILAAMLALSITSASLPTRVAFAEPTAAELANARKLFDEALKLEKAGEYKEALEKLRLVAEVKFTPQVRYHVAICLEGLGQLVDAYEQYTRALAEADNKEGNEAKTVVKASKQHLADLDGRIPRIVLKMPEDVVSAKVQIDDGEPIGALTNPQIKVDPGQHELVVIATGRVTFRKKLDLKEKDPPLTIEVVLPREDDEGAPIKPKPKPKPVEVEPAVAAPLPPKPEAPPEGTRSRLPYLVGGIGVATLGLAGVMYALRAGTISEMDEACVDRAKCPRGKSDVEDRGRMYTTVGNVFLGVSIVAIGTAVVLMVMKPGEVKTAQAPGKLTVGAGPTPLSIGLSGSF